MNETLLIVQHNTVELYAAIQNFARYSTRYITGITDLLFQITFLSVIFDHDYDGIDYFSNLLLLLILRGIFILDSEGGGGGGGYYKTVEINRRDLRISMWYIIYIFQLMGTVIVWNSKGIFWYSTQNMLPIHWNICITRAHQHFQTVAWGLYLMICMHFSHQFF